MKIEQQLNELKSLLINQNNSLMDLKQKVSDMKILNEHLWKNINPSAEYLTRNEAAKLLKCSPAKISKLAEMHPIRDETIRTKKNYILSEVLKYGKNKTKNIFKTHSKDITKLKQNINK